MMKATVLYLALIFSKVHYPTMKIRGIGKLVIASIMGTFVEIIGLIMGVSYTFLGICVHFLEVPLMVRFVLGNKHCRMLRVIFYGYFFTVLTNGVLEVLWNQFGEYGSYLFYIIFSCGAAIVVVRVWQNYSRMQKGVYRVQLVHQGSELQIKGFYDSGNQLKDPYTQKGVHILSQGLWNHFKSSKETAVYVPYHALGKEQGILEVYYIDELIIEGERERITIQNCPVGVTKDNLFEGKNYEIILNEEVF